MRCLIYDAERGVWLRHENPKTILETDRIERVAPLLSEVIRLREQYNWSAVGFISYEASPAFDPLYPSHKGPAGISLPLLRFALYDSCTGFTDLPAEADWESDRTSLHGYPPELWALSSWRGQPEFPDYRTAILEIKEELARGMSYQINFTWRQYADFSGSPYAWFRALCGKRPGSYLAYLEWEDRAVLSLSPELFFTLNGSELTLKPMKGTARPTGDPEKDAQIARELSSDQKNRAENLMICDMIRNDAGRIAEPGSVTVPELFGTELFPTVIQMTSTVKARLGTQGTSEVFRALFPCASITGAPKLSSMRIINRLEGSPRGLYTGSIGRIDGATGRMVFNVAIRTAVVDRNRHLAVYGAGSGIVWDSDPQSEYSECLLKTQVVEPDEAFYVFDSLLLENGRFLYAEAHKKRLIDSCRYFAHPLDEEILEREMAKLALRYPEGSWKVRLLAARDGGISCEAAPPPPLPAPYRLALAPFRVHSGDPFLRHKTSRRSIFDRALEAARALHPGASDAILWNERGELTETCRANLVLELDGKLYTPPLDSGLLPGVLRADLLSRGVLAEQVLYPQDLKRAQSIRIINSVRGEIPAHCYCDMSPL